MVKKSSGKSDPAGIVGQGTQLGEVGQEYYMFDRKVFYEGGADQPCSVLSLALDDQALPSKAEVLKYARTAPAGKYVVVKVVDEMEVESPQRENIVRTNPRLKRPRGGE